jgi:hypothetical protein
MGRRNRLVVTGLAAVMLAVACGDDPPAKQPAGAAGSSNPEAGEAGQTAAGTSSTPGGGTAGSAAEGGAMNAAGEAASAGSEPGSAGQAGEGGAAEDPDDVVGRFLAEYEPVPNAVIIVNGVTTQTDADGYFTVKDVADEYQMIAALPELKQALVYEGVRTRHPIAQFGVLLHFEWPYEASVRGKLNGPGGAPVASELTDVGVVSDTQGILQRRLITPPAGFDMQPSWNLTDVLDVELWAIQEVAGEYRG